MLSMLGEDPRVDLYDISADFLQEDGSIFTDVMADFFHPTDKGYEIFAKALNPVLLDLFK